MKDKEIVIDELEEAMKHFVPHSRPWSEREVAICRKYKGRVPISTLAKYLNRSRDATRKKCEELGLTHLSQSGTP